MNVLFVAVGPDVASIEAAKIVQRHAPVGHRVQIERGEGFVVAVATREPSSAIACDAGLVVALDGRIDARASLVRELGLEASVGDAVLILHAVRRFGREAPRRVLGELAFVAFDVSRREILAARDAFGVRPLYFSTGRGGNVFASDVPLLVAAGEVNAPDPRSLAELVTFRFVEGDRTLYRGVSSLRPGSFVVADEAGTRGARYYALGDTAFRCQGGVEAVQEALDAAVGDRVGHGAAGLFASGGVDSSLIAAIASRRLAREGMAPPQLLHLRCSQMECDEIVDVTIVAKHLAAPLHVVEGPRPYPVADPTPIEVPDVYMAAFRDLLAFASRAGVTTLLRGDGSDELQVRWGYEISDALTRGELRTALSMAGPLRSASARADLIHAVLRLAAPDWVRRLRARRAEERLLPSWLTPFARRVARERDEEAWQERAASGERGHEAAVWDAQLFTQSMGLTFLLGEHVRLARAFGIDATYPYLDRRVVDALFALTDSQRKGPANDKPALRTLLARSFPSSLGLSFARRDYTDCHVHGWVRSRAEWIDFAGRAHRLAALGIVNERFGTVAVQELDACAPSYELRAALRLERWLARFDL